MEEEYSLNTNKLEFPFELKTSTFVQTLFESIFITLGFKGGPPV